MKTLALTSRPVLSRSSGYDIRVANLSAQTAGEVYLLAIPITASEAEAPTLSTATTFVSSEVTHPVLGGPLSLRRHLRLSDEHFLARANPAGVHAARRRLHEVVSDLRVDRVVVFGADAAQVAAPVLSVPWFLDVCDSHSLILRRRRAARPAAGPVGRTTARLELARVEAKERSLVRQSWAAATVSDVDTRRVQELVGPSPHVRTVANGVDPSLLRPLDAASTDRSVAFWGNLSFEPNEDALRFYVREVHRPYLGPAGVTLRIAGPNPPAWLRDEAAHDDGIQLLGFVSDLAPVVTISPVMINPMRLGSGVKNKVLEAFGLGMAVVSTTRGAEGVPGATDGVHVSLADSALELAARVGDLLDDPTRLQAQRLAAHEMVAADYGWDRVGRVWNDFLDHAGHPPA